MWQRRVPLAASGCPRLTGYKHSWRGIWLYLGRRRVAKHDPQTARDLWRKFGVHVGMQTGMSVIETAILLVVLVMLAVLGDYVADRRARGR